MDELKAKKEIQGLVDDFKINNAKYKRMSEADIETQLIEPLFKALGWEKGDFWKREKAHRGAISGFADYSFKIDERIVFYLEAKKLGVPLEKEADRQVVSYALSKRIPFAVSTNFESLKIFCVEQEDAQENVFRVFRKPEDYINSFSDLLLLSKESFENGYTLKKAEDEERLKKRMSIDKPLLSDLMYIRKLITEDIENTYPKKYELNERDEIVQRIIDRLIFIRRCEDLGMNPDNIYLSEMQELPGDKAQIRLKDIFKSYNKIYNSGLFAPSHDNDCDVIEIDGQILKKLVGLLYESKDKQYIYNFDWINADVLGEVYEQYLGKILEQTKSGKSKLKEGQAHKKEQGIYYTPTYVVDYIVKNTLLEVINKRNKKSKQKEIRILDPACGSGSFLIKAFDYLYNTQKDNEETKQHKLDSQGRYSIKTEILKRNIYGVDLDNKAVEITKLNLLLKAAEPYRKLPEELELHIKNGNSLIDDERISPKNFFEWKNEFQEGSFDIIIGNPPYGADFKDDELTYFENKFKTSSIRNYDSYIFFIENCVRLLKEGGLFGFIVPDTFLRKSDLITLRELILENFKIKSIAEVGAIFGDAKVTENVVFIFEKCSNKKDRENNVFTHRTLNKNLKRTERLTLISQNKWESEGNIKQKNWSLAPELRLGKFNQPKLLRIINKIEKGTAIKDISDIEISRGSEGGKEQIKKEKVNSSYKPILIPDDVWKYGIKFNNRFFPLPKQSTEKYQKEKLLIIRIRNTRLDDRIIATYDNSGLYCLKTLQIINLKNGSNLNLKYILALLNSKVMNFYCKHYLSDDINKKYIEGLKIIIDDNSKIIKLVDKLIDLNKHLSNFNDKKTSETARLEQEISEAEKEIDNEVYKIYEIDETEKKIIEQALI